VGKTRVAVIGRSGQLARSLAVSAQSRSGLELVAFGRPELDLEGPITTAAVLAEWRPDVVINVAAYTAVDQAEVETERAFRINAEAAGAIAEDCSQAGAKLIHVSTDYVFDGTSPDPYTPDSPTNPLSVYGQSKLAGEFKVREATSAHLIVRTAWVYSPFSHNFLKTMLELSRSRNVVRVVADQRGNPSSASDLAEGLLRIVEEWDRGADTGLGSTYHLAGSGAASWADFASEIFAASRRYGLNSCQVEPITTAEWPTRAQRPRNSILDCSRFTEDFGFKMPRWQDALYNVVRQLASGAQVDLT
jgi:dTDP-4-dehydrorhamnose reductase